MNLTRRNIKNPMIILVDHFLYLFPPFIVAKHSFMIISPGISCYTMYRLKKKTKSGGQYKTGVNNPYPRRNRRTQRDNEGTTIGI